MSDMNEVKALMKEAGWGDMATSDGKVVDVRPMGGWAWVRGELWCATADFTDKVSHLKKVPYAAWCFSLPEGKHVRINGPCTVSTNQDDKDILYAACPIIKDHIPDPKVPEYVVLRLKPERIRIMKPDMSYDEVKPE